MSVSKISLNVYAVRVRKNINGKTTGLRSTITGTMLDAKKEEIRLSEELEARIVSSLKSNKISTFGDVLKYYLENCDVDTTKAKCHYDRMLKDLGNVPVYQLSDRFTTYWRLLKTERSKKTGRLLSDVSKNRLLMYGKIALNFCVRRGLIERNPLLCFDNYDEPGRDRILSQDEILRITNVMKLRKSYLLEAFMFSLRNPIRIDDLRNLTRENIDYFRPWIHFFASKTKKRRNRETCLINLDEDTLNYFRNIPNDCPWLFYRQDGKGNFHKIGNIHEQWHSILEESGISDVHWHDLKHCAITSMLDNGYSFLDLENLGIQFDTEMIKRYYHFDAGKVLLKQKSGQKSEVVASNNGLQVGFDQ
jgi:integrase